MNRTSARFALVLATTGLVLSGCGSTEPKPLKPLEPAVPADLCSALPKDLTQGLQTSSTTSESGDPTSACALQSGPGAKADVRALVTVLMLNDEDTADTTYQSQCRALDPQELHKKQVQVEGADEACGGQGKASDTAVLAAVAGRLVVTVRYSSTPAGKPDALTRATELAAAALPSSPS